ncbi:MAG: DUF2851 family protein [Verrucomicrobia bacterium]|jgi:hypothetical protein|nr:DUF2851 family protein [Verrucomicrobiota bacterium]
MRKNEVQEIQGLYGPFSLSERVLQKIWLRGDFDQNGLRTLSGKSLRILHPGRWNLLDGPDFLEARLELDGQPCIGDVEVHFHASDWNLHGHGANPNFANVCLHVVLIPETSDSGVRTSRGMEPETVYLMPVLERDLEDYAVDDALLELEQVEDAAWMLAFIERPLEERRARLRVGAEARWTRKVAFAGKRLSGAGWQDACHQYCLEVLGYARNRAPMARLALRHGIDDFASGRVSVDSLFEEQDANWRLSGLRPANHPRQRLRQYASICREHPDWPERLGKVLQSFPRVGGGVTGAAFRRAHGIPQLAGCVSTEVFGGAISAKRLNTLICDALLPLAAAEAMLPGVEIYWQQWPAGDAPDALHRFLKQAQIIDRAEPFSNGQLQGALQLLLDAG